MGLAWPTWSRGAEGDTHQVSVGERARAIGHWARLLGRRRVKPIHETIAGARKAADAMNRPIGRNEEAPDADLRHAPFGPLIP